MLFDIRRSECILACTLVDTHPIYIKEPESFQVSIGKPIVEIDLSYVTSNCVKLRSILFIIKHFFSKFKAKICYFRMIIHTCQSIFKLWIWWEQCRIFLFVTNFSETVKSERIVKRWQVIWIQIIIWSISFSSVYRRSSMFIFRLIMLWWQVVSIYYFRNSFFSSAYILIKLNLFLRILQNYCIFNLL